MNVENTKTWIYKCLTEKKLEYSHAHKGLERGDIEELTKEFLSDLRTVFEHFAGSFNVLKGESTDVFIELSSEKIRDKLKDTLFIYDLADTAGFMLFRKGYKLIFSYVQPGRIKVQFFKKKPLSETEMFVDAFINAITNESLSIKWVQENQKGFVDMNILARYYMKRFLQEI